MSKATLVLEVECMGYMWTMIKALEDTGSQSIQEKASGITEQMEKKDCISVLNVEIEQTLYRGVGK